MKRMRNKVVKILCVNMKNIVVFTGAGISKESGISTFRDTNDGLYLDTDIMEIMSASGWKNKKEDVLKFHNMLREKVKECQPNEAHKLLKDLELYHHVTIVTQNVDHLHEKAGSTNVLHLHGELFKSRSTFDQTIYPCEGDLNIGDKCPNGSQLRPHTVLFEEIPYNVQESYDALMEADILIIIGTSLGISYTIQLLGATQAKEIYYIDPKPSKILEYRLSLYNKPAIKYIRKKASEGMRSLFKKLSK